MNRLQVQVAQCQGILRRCELEKAEKDRSINELETRARQATFRTRQLEVYCKDLGKQLHSERDEKLELQKTLEIQEAGRDNMEREKAELWQTVRDQVMSIQILHKHLDGPKLSAEERCVDVAKLLLECEEFKLKVGRLEEMLTARTMEGQQMEHAEAFWYNMMQGKDRTITALEQAIVRMKQNIGTPNQSSQDKSGKL